MVSKSQIKLITSLEQKKIRTKLGLFLVEGIKGIKEFLNSPLQLHSLYTTNNKFDAPNDKVHLISTEDLKKISRLTTPQTAVAIFEVPVTKPGNLKGLILVLDGVRDPGNLGTIIRLCDWFGVETLICSRDTVDCYNPKVVQASMGSLARVAVYYEELYKIITENKDIPVYGTFLEGEDVYKTSFPEQGFLILGNEANGITSEIEKLVTQKVSIPRFGVQQSAESLNVATAAAVFLSEIKRQNNY